VTHRAASAAALLALVLTAGCHDGATTVASCRLRPTTVEAAPLGVRNLLRSGPRTTVDVDGDGRADPVEADGDGIRVGDRTYRAAGAQVALLTWGDLDGDGRDDLVLSVDRAGEHAVVVVPGTTPSGVHVPATVGVRVDDQLDYVWLADLDGRPGADFALPERGAARSTTTIWSGAEVLDAGAGGDARGLAPARRLRGLVRGTAALSPRGRRVTLLYEPGSPARVRIAERPGTVLVGLGAPSRVEDLLVFDRGGRRHIGLVVDHDVAVWDAPPTCG
jgi:hypothetical protein